MSQQNQNKTQLYINGETNDEAWWLMNSPSIATVREYSKLGFPWAQECITACLDAGVDIDSEPEATVMQVPEVINEIIQFTYHVMLRGKRIAVLGRRDVVPDDPEFADEHWYPITRRKVEADEVQRKSSGQKRMRWGTVREIRLEPGQEIRIRHGVPIVIEVRERIPDKSSEDRAKSVDSC